MAMCTELWCRFLFVFEFERGSDFSPVRAKSVGSGMSFAMRRVDLCGFLLEFAFGAESVRRFDEGGVGENVGMESVSFVGGNRFGARDFGRVQDGRPCERHPGRVISIGAAPIIFCSRTALAVSQAGFVVTQRIVFFMCEIMMVHKEGKIGDTLRLDVLCPDCYDFVCPGKLLI